MTLDELHPDEQAVPLEGLGDHIDRWSRSAGITVEAWALPGVPLTGPVAMLVRTTILDMLDGFQADGTVRHVGLALTVSARGLRLTVSGDGVGLPPGQLVTRLRAAQAGFADMGGKLMVNVTLGGGITVRAALPSRRGPRG